MHEKKQPHICWEQAPEREQLSCKRSASHCSSGSHCISGPSPLAFPPVWLQSRVFSHTHCSHSLHAAPRGFLAAPDHLVIPYRGKGKKMEWVDKCTAAWFIKLPRKWIYGSLEVFVFLECSVAIIVTHMWTTTPTCTPALRNIDKQSQKGKKTNKHKSDWLLSGRFGEKFLMIEKRLLQVCRQTNNVWSDRFQ